MASATFPNRVYLGYVKNLKFSREEGDEKYTRDIVVSLGKHSFKLDITPSCCERQYVQLFEPGNDTPFCNIDMAVTKMDEDMLVKLNNKVVLKNIKERRHLTIPTQEQTETERFYHSLVFGLFDEKSRELLYILKFINVHNGYYAKALNFYNKRNEHIYKSFI